MLDKDSAAILADIRNEWDEAEGYIKIAEQVASDVVTPAIAELRYAGRRLVDAINGVASGQDADKVRAFIEDARFGCQRAKHDAVDAAFSKMAVDLAILMNRLGYKAVLVAYPNIEAFLLKLDEAHKKIAATRTDRDRRQEIYQNLAQIDFPSLVADYNAVKRSEALMRRVAAKDQVAFWIATLLAGVGILLAVIGFGLAYYFWRYPVEPIGAHASTAIAPASTAPTPSISGSSVSPAAQAAKKTKP